MSSEEEPGSEPKAETETETATELAARVAELEATVEELQSTLSRRTRDLDLLAAAVDVDPVDAHCPVCGEGGLRRESGLSWARAVCDDCGESWYL